MPIIILLIIGILIATAVHLGAKKLRDHPDAVRKMAAGGGLMALLWLACRIGLGRIASIVTGLAMLLPAIHHLLRQMGYEPPSQKPSPPSAMTIEEACKVLGVGSAASESDIREAHKRLMQKNHPDQGGNDYLASKINQARDMLLKQKR